MRRPRRSRRQPEPDARAEPGERLGHRAAARDVARERVDDRERRRRRRLGDDEERPERELVRRGEQQRVGRGERREARRGAGSARAGRRGGRRPPRRACSPGPTPRAAGRSRLARARSRRCSAAAARPSSAPCARRQRARTSRPASPRRPGVSEHLGVLRRAGLVRAQRDGRRVLYSRIAAGEQMLRAQGGAAWPRVAGPPSGVADPNTMAAWPM